jgi:paraquat-inducible protein A
MSGDGRFTCRLCGHEHRSIALAPGEQAHCVRCDSVIATGSRLGPQGVLVFAITGLIMAVPAAVLPFVSAGKLGNVRVCLLFTDFGALWDGGMRALAVLVLLCGGIIPVAFLSSLVALHAPRRVPGFPEDPAELSRWAQALKHWAIPEVLVLAVLVALTKLGSVVDVTIGPGFWCYCAMTLSLIVAQQAFDLKSFDGGARPRSSQPEAAP